MQVTLASAVNWFRAIVNGRERPKFEWEEGLYKLQLNEKNGLGEINRDFWYQASRRDR